MSVSLSATDVQNIVKVCEVLSKTDWKGFIAALHSQDTETKLKEGYILTQEVASILGIFCPVAAIVANDMQALELLFTLYDMVCAYNKAHPEALKPPPHTVSVWGSPVSDKGIFQ